MNAPGITFDRDRWLALAAALGDHPLVAPLEAARLDAEFSAEERAAYAAAGDGFGWLFGSDTLGWFPRYPGRHTRAGPNGESILVDPPRRSLGTGKDGKPLEVIVTEPLPAIGVQRLLRRGIAREPEAYGSGVFGVLIALDPKTFPWRVDRTEPSEPLGGAWLLDKAGSRIAWVPDSTDAHRIVRDVNAARVAETDQYRIGALRDSLDRLRQVAYPDDRYQPPASLTRLHEEATTAVNRLLGALPSWANAAPARAEPTWAEPIRAEPSHADAEPDPPGAAPEAVGAAVAGGAPSAPQPAPRSRSSWPLALLVGGVLGWLLRGWW